MNTRSQKITIWDNVLPQTITSSTDANPIVITKANHGYSTGDIIMIQGHATNLNANGIFKIVVLTANTFTLKNLYTGAAIAGSGAGAGAGGIMVKMSTNQIPAISQEFREAVFQLSTSGNANLTIKFAISQGKPESGSQGAGQDVPNFGATISVANPYSFAQLQPPDTNTPVAGTTGVALTGTDVAAQNYKINNALQKYLMPLLTAWSAGRITLVLEMSNLQ